MEQATTYKPGINAENHHVYFNLDSKSDRTEVKSHPSREWKYSGQHRNERWEYIQRGGKNRPVPSTLINEAVSQREEIQAKASQVHSPRDPQPLIKRVQNSQQKQILSLLVQSG